jgi:hypothetical protein
MYEKQGNPNDPENRKYKELYRFYLDIVAEAHDLYEKWKSHQGFQGTKLHAIKRDEHGNILEVPDGIVFPILAALSAFATKTRSGWRIMPPETFQDEDLIRAAKAAYQEMANSNPNVMGKNRACYFHLFDITSLHRRLSGNARTA